MNEFPQRSDVVVVGSGLVGLCAGLFLQRIGHEVTIIDRAHPGAGASSHNAGIVSIGNVVPTGTPGVLRSIPTMLRDPLAPLAIRWSYLPKLTAWLVRFLLASRTSRVEAISLELTDLMNKAIEAYQDLVPDAFTEGIFTYGGHLVAYSTNEAFSKASYAMDLRRRRGVQFEVLNPDEIVDLDPALAGRFAKAIWFRAGVNTDPVLLVDYLAGRFVSGGGRICQAECVGFGASAGSVTSVMTDRGSIMVDSVVLSAGAWSRRLARELGARVPLDTERGYGVEIPDSGIPLKTPFISADLHLGFNPLGNRLLLAGTDELAGLSAPPNYERAERLIAGAKVIFPELRADGAEQWMSYRPSLPDSKPVLGVSPRYRNAILAFGHGHVGLTLAAVTGNLVAELVDGGEASLDLAPFRPDRFSWIRRKSSR